MKSTKALFDEISEEPEFKQPKQVNSKTQSLFDSVKNDYKPSTIELFSSLEPKPVEEYKSPKDAQGNYPEEMSYWERAKHYFKGDELGKAANLQALSGGSSGAPALTPKAGAKVAVEAGTIAAIEAAFIPVYGAAALTYAPRIAAGLTRLTQSALTGAGTHATSHLLEEGELPSKEELLEHGGEWMALDALFQGLHLTAIGSKKTFDFGKAVQKIAKEDGVPATTVLGKLWDSTKNYLKSKFDRTIELPQDINKGDVEILSKRTQQIEDQSAKNRNYDIDITPEKPKSEPYEIGFEEKKQIEHKPEVNKVEEVKSKEKEKFPENKAKFTEGGTQKYFPSGTIGDYVKDPEVRKALSEVLDYPVRYAHESLLQGQGYYIKGEPITLSKKIEGGDLSNHIVIHEATHLLRDIRGRDQNKNIEYNERPEEKSAEKLSRWAIIKEREYQSKTKPEVIPEEKHEKTKDPLPESKVNEIKRQDITPQGLKTQKQYILNEVENALISPSKGDKVIIDVPGEGMRVKNEPKTKPAKTTLKSEIQEEEPELEAKQRQTPPRQTRPLRPVKGIKQAIARSKIISLLRKAFNDPIRLGKISQKRAAGIHKLWPKVTRLLKDNDIETVAHEIGHNLHTTLYGGNAKTAKEQFKNINDALKPYLNELKPLAHYEPWGMEGFAEFTRLYVTNPIVAQQLAPNFYAKFEADLEAQYPKMKNALLEARDYYDKWIHGTPRSRIRAHTSYAQDKGKLANIIDSIKKNLNLDYLKTQFLDDVFPAKRLVAEAFGIPISEVENLKDPLNLYRSLRVLKGAVGKGDVFLLHETFNAKTLDKINGSLKDILKQLKNEEEYREFNDYLISRRSIEKSQQKIDTGIQLGDAIDVEKDLRAKYSPLALELDKYNDTLLRYAMDSGLISGDQYNTIKKNNLLYTPFQRVMEKEKGGMATGGGSTQATNPIKQMRGSTRDIIAPVESIIKNTYSIILNAEKNLSGQVLAKLAAAKPTLGQYVEALPTPIKVKGSVQGEQVAKELAKEFEAAGLTDLIQYDANGKVELRDDIADAIPDIFLRFGAGKYPVGENIITVFDKGKPKYYEVSPEIFEMWNKGIGAYNANLITKILRVPARILRAGAILNPKFMMKNIVRDTWGSWLFTKYGKSIKDPVSLFIDTLYSPLAMLSVAAKKQNLYIEWMKAGGDMSTMQSLDRDNVVKKLDEVRGKWQGITPIKWLRKLAGISEETNRLSEFGKALEVEGKTRLGREIAAFASRDLSIDFAKIGMQTKALNQIIPFWNATVQGGDKFLRALINPKDRKNFIPRIIGFIVIPSLMLAWLNKDDENIKEFYEEEKDFNFITKVGNEYIKIPVPFETGVMAHGLTQRMFNYFIKKDPAAFEEFMGSLLTAMSPNFIPAIANPIIETFANKNFFTGAPIIPKQQEDLISKYQYKRGTSSTARLLGRAMTYMLGQDTRSKAASPAFIDHFINSWTGGLGRLMINISDASLEAAGLGDKIPGYEQTIIEKLGLDAFKARYPRASSRSIEKFYDNFADATARQKSIRYAEKLELETEDEQEKAYERFDKIYDYPTLQSAYKAIQACQKEINNIWNDPSIDKDLKQRMVDDLYLEQIDFARVCNEDIAKHRLTEK
jgi:hypothetical protein